MKIKINRYSAMCLITGGIILSGIFGYAHMSSFIKPVVNKIKSSFSSNVSPGEKLSKSIDGVNDIINDEIGFKSCYIDAYSFMQKICGTKVFDNSDIVKLNNGSLASWRKQPDDETLNKNVENLYDLFEYCSNKNIYFKYYNTPDKLSKYDNQLPNEMQDFINPHNDRFLSMLDNRDIPYTDYRELLHNEYENDYSAFFTTDHHWKPLTGFWAFKTLYKDLSAELNIKYDNKITDINNYDILTRKNCFLGSQGKTTGRFVAGIDDIDIITPKFDTSFNTEQPLKNLSASGKFADVLMRMDIAESNDLYNTSQYAAYLGGDFAYEIIKNNLSGNDKKIIILKDSFSDCVLPFLSLGISEIHAFDLRDITGYKIDSIYKYIDDIEPDAVIFFYSPLRIYYEESFTFENR